ncbi:hypothetical protein DXG01_012463, partial [Tephrocybe rancida]
HHHHPSGDPEQRRNEAGQRGHPGNTNSAHPTSPTIREATPARHGETQTPRRAPPAHARPHALDLDSNPRPHAATSAPQTTTHPALTPTDDLRKRRQPPPAEDNNDETTAHPRPSPRHHDGADNDDKTRHVTRQRDTTHPPAAHRPPGHQQRDDVTPRTRPLQQATTTAARRHHNATTAYPQLPGHHDAKPRTRLPHMRPLPAAHAPATCRLPPAAAGGGAAFFVSLYYLFLFFFVLITPPGAM